MHLTLPEEVVRRLAVTRCYRGMVTHLQRKTTAVYGDNNVLQCDCSIVGYYSDRCCTYIIHSYSNSSATCSAYSLHVL